jgi:hypothetical protein
MNIMGIIHKLFLNKRKTERGSKRNGAQLQCPNKIKSNGTREENTM